MARVVKTEKMKKKKKNTIVTIVILVVILIALGLGVFFVWKKFFTKPEKQKIEVVILDSIDEYGYNLSDSDSNLYKTEYEELKKVLIADEINIQKYSESVAKLFVIDLYSMGSKLNKYDVGGKDFYNSDKLVMFEQKVMDSIYEHMLDNSYGDRKQELPMVNKVEVDSTNKITYKLDKNPAECYQVKLKWTYEKSMGYDYQGTVVVCADKAPKWSVVDFQPTLDPKYS